MNNNVIIIGGGPCGLEASAQLHKMGYNVILVEKEDQLGGHLAKWDRLFPQGIEAKEVLDKLLGNIGGVKCFLNTRVNSINQLDKEYNVILSNGITVLATAVLFATGFDLFKAEKILLWEGDLFIFAISVHLFTSIVAAPLSSYEVMDKILYIDNYHDTDLSGAFAGFLTLPAFVWGLFFMVITSLPVIYYSFSRRKA